MLRARNTEICEFRPSSGYALVGMTELDWAEIRSRAVDRCRMSPSMKLKSEIPVQRRSVRLQVEAITSHGGSVRSCGAQLRQFARAGSNVAFACLFSGACGGYPTAPAQNGAPTIVVAFDGTSTCTPQIGRPCELKVVAAGRDPDGDALSYRWSGCASGTASRAICTVERPGAVIASVDVSDDHGHIVHAEASGTGAGENHPPGVFIGYITVFPSGTIELLGAVNDPDEGYRCGSQYCVGISASGACGPPTNLRCTCLAGLEADVTPYSHFRHVLCDFHC